MIKTIPIIAIATACLLAACASPQDNRATGMANAQDMTGQELQALLANGLKLTLGGAGEGYSGMVELKADGTGIGEATSEDGRLLDISGTWEIHGSQFCRKWKFNDFKEECETWRKLGHNKVEVIVDGERIGVNSW